MLSIDFVLADILVRSHQTIIMFIPRKQFPGFKYRKHVLVDFENTIIDVQVLFLTTKHMPELLVDGTALEYYSVDPIAAAAAIEAHTTHKTALHMDIAKIIALGLPFMANNYPSPLEVDNHMQAIAATAMVHDIKQ